MGDNSTVAEALHTGGFAEAPAKIDPLRLDRR